MGMVVGVLWGTMSGSAESESDLGEGHWVAGWAAVGEAPLVVGCFAAVAAGTPV